MALLPLRYILIIKPAGIEPLLLPVGALVPPQRCFYRVDGHLRMGEVIEVNTIDSCAAAAPAPILNHGCISGNIAIVDRGSGTKLATQDGLIFSLPDDRRGIILDIGTTFNSTARGKASSGYYTARMHSDPSASVDEATLPTHGVEPAGTPATCAALPGGIPAAGNQVP
jgi:hypothetical protein